MSGATRRVQESATARLGRLLTMVPWLVNRQGIDLAEAAAGLGVSEQQLEDDLQLLFMCGYGQMPDELIDAQWEGGRVFVTNAETIARPLRLGVDEALTLMVGLRALAAVPGIGDRDAIERALAKLERATGASAEAAARVDVSIDDAVEAAVLADARRALEGRRRVHLRYLVPSRDEATERDVDPMRVLMVDGRWYLEGWCRRAEQVRLFRLDRIEALTVLDQPADVPPAATARDLREGLFQPSPDDTVVTLELDPAGHWVVDYYPVESVERLPDDRLLVRLRVGDDRWLRALTLRLGGAGRVLDPPALALAVHRRAQEALEAYVRA
jgi:proteasome accessory factor C